MEKRYISPKELAEYLGLKIDTIYMWVRLKKIPYSKPCRCVRFDLRKIEKWMEAHSVAEIH